MPGMRTLLAIDIGTSSTKAALFTNLGEMLAQHSVPYLVEIPHAGWAEQNPMDWWKATCNCTREVLHTAGYPTITGIAVSGQAPSLVAVDRDGEPVRPAVLWLDRRAHQQVLWLQDHLGLEKAIASTGNTIDSYYGGVKWLWFKQHEPELYRRTWKILQASSYILYHLTGQIVLDYSQAGLCSPCFNLHQRIWNPETCRLMGIDMDKLPRLVPSTAIIGQVTKTASESCGIAPGTPVAAGGGDYALSCLGAGAIKSGDAAAMLGTAGNLLVTDPAGTDPRLINTVHVTGGALSLGGVMAGGLVGWLQDILDLEDDHLFTILEMEAANTPPGADGLVFLPYLLGERTPIWDPSARGVYFGLSAYHKRGHLYRALLEGAAFAFRQMLEIIRRTGTEIDSITLTDGGAASPLWRQIFADILGIPVHWQPKSGGTLLGTAMLAAVACGELADFQEIDSWIGPVHIHHPIPERRTVYDRNFSVYSQLYDRLRDLFPVLETRGRLN
jgi:D-xylulose kinase